MSDNNCKMTPVVGGRRERELLQNDTCCRGQAGVTIIAK